MKLWASAVSRRKSSPTPLQFPFVPKEVSAISVRVPPRKIGPPESPKHWPPLPFDTLPEIFTNSSSLPLPTLRRFEVAPKRVKKASGCFLQLGSQGSGLPKCCTP